MAFYREFRPRIGKVKFLIALEWIYEIIKEWTLRKHMRAWKPTYVSA